MSLLIVVLALASGAWSQAYQWDGKEFDEYHVSNLQRGYIEEYTNLDEFCHSILLPPGFPLMHPIILALVYLLALIYLFLGIAIISDIFME